MPKTRKSHPPSLKAKVAVEAIKAHKTAAQIAQMFGVHPTQVGGWKKQALAGLSSLRASWPMRGSPAPRMLPKAAALTVTFGLLRFTRFVKLKNSAERTRGIRSPPGRKPA